ncbi:MAG: hypothetical protein AAF658_12575, partial [Myxococcota bacterium]
MQRLAPPLDTQAVRYLGFAYLALTLSISTASAAEAPPERNPFVLHARALLAESEGKTTQALGLLRKAVELGTDDSEIVFDLARISLASRSPDFVADSKPLLARSPTTDDERLLHAHARFARGELEAARALTTRVQPTSASAAEAKGLLALIDEAMRKRDARISNEANSSERARLDAEARERAEAAERAREQEDEQAQQQPVDAQVNAEVAGAASPERSPFRLQLSLLGQYDTNPTVAPTDSGAAILGVREVESPRIAADLAVGYTLEESATQLSDLRVSVGYGLYTESQSGSTDTTSEEGVESDTQSATVGESPDDFNGINASLRFGNTFLTGDWLFSVDLLGFATTLQDTEFYSATGTLSTNALYNLGLARVGAYGRGGYNYFREEALTGELDVSSDEGQRDGPTAAGGLMLMGDYTIAGARLFVDANVGYQLEDAPTGDFTDAGLETALGAFLQAGSVSVSTRGTYQMRSYDSGREDDLLIVNADVGVEFAKGYIVRVGYLLIQNTSQDAVFEYTRHVGYGGL